MTQCIYHTSLSLLVSMYMQNMIIGLLHMYGTILGRVVAVDRVVPKAQYEEAKLVSTHDNGVDDDSDEGQSSVDEQLVSEHSDREGTGSDDDNEDDDNEDDVTPHDTLNSDGTEQSEGDDKEQSEDEDEEKEENFTKGKVRTLPHKKKTTNDVAEGRTVFIRYTCTSIVNNVTY